MFQRLRFALLALFVSASPAAACPFCAAESQTLTEEMDGSSVTMLARLATPSEASQKLADAEVPYQFVDPDTGAARFAVENVLIGQPLMEGVEEIEAIYFGEPDTDRLYMIRGVGEPPDWAIPLPLSEIAAEYVPKLLALPESGADRLAFFQQYLEHPDPLLGQDAYDEFARAPYQDVVDLAPRMDRDQLRKWIEDFRVSPSRRRLFLTMLGVCGEPEDLKRLEQLLTSDSRVLSPVTEAGAEAAMAVGGSPVVGMASELVRFGERQRKLGLDALIACHLTLAGKHGNASEALDLIDERFLRDPDADYSHIYAALQALRFLAEEQQELVPLPRLLESARLLLDNSEFADQVIPDLARWEDWSVLERLAEMYQLTFDEDAENAPVRYVREPIITYLDVAADNDMVLDPDINERARVALAEIEPIDLKTVKRARSLRSFGVLGQAWAKRAAGDVPQLDESVALAEGATVGESEGYGDFESNAAKQSDEQLDEQPPAPFAGGVEQAEPVGEASVEMTSSEPDPEPETAQPAAAVAATSEPATTPEPELVPPSRALLVGLPIAAAAALVGLFWLVLRGGVA